MLHCRELQEVRDADEAVTAVRHVLQGHPNVSKDGLIHMHRFTGTWPVVQRWLESFPNTYIGLMVWLEDTALSGMQTRERHLSRCTSPGY